MPEVSGIARATAPITAGAGLEEIMLLGRMRTQPDEEPRDVALLFSYRPGSGVGVSVSAPPADPVPPLDAYTEKVRRSRARGSICPYELIPQLTGADGTFTEYDLDEDRWLVPVERAPGQTRRGSSSVASARPRPAIPKA